jgi:hypothetical protein
MKSPRTVVGLHGNRRVPLFDKGLVWKHLRHELGTEGFGIIGPLKLGG